MRGRARLTWKAFAGRVRQPRGPRPPSAPPRRVHGRPDEHAEPARRDRQVGTGAAKRGLFVIPSGPTSDTASEVRDAERDCACDERDPYEIRSYPAGPPSGRVGSRHPLIGAVHGRSDRNGGCRSNAAERRDKGTRKQIGFLGGRIVGGIHYVRPSRATQWTRQIGRLFRAVDRRKQRAADRPKTASDARRSPQPLDATSGASDANTP
jgi:hypothetical protein